MNIYQIPYLVRNLRIGILELEYLQSALSVGYVDIALVFYYVVGRVGKVAVCNHLVSFLVENHKSESAVCDIYILLSYVAAIGVTFILSGILTLTDGRTRHLVVPEFMAFHIVNIHTGSTAANVNLVIIHTNHVLTVVWLNSADGKALDRLAEVFILLVEDFHGSRDSLCLAGSCSVQINCNDLTIADS